MEKAPTAGRGISIFTKTLNSIVAFAGLVLFVFIICDDDNYARFFAILVGMALSAVQFFIFVFTLILSPRLWWIAVITLLFGLLDIGLAMALPHHGGHC